MAQVLNTAQVAEKLDTDARTLRKFLRATTEDKSSLPGKGKRYSFEGKDIAGLKKQYAVWVAARAAQVEDAPDEAAETE